MGQTDWWQQFWLKWRKWRIFLDIWRIFLDIWRIWRMFLDIWRIWLFWRSWLARVGILGSLIGYFLDKNLQNCDFRVYYWQTDMNVYYGSHVETKRSLVNSVHHRGTVHSAMTAPGTRTVRTMVVPGGNGCTALCTPLWHPSGYPTWLNSSIFMKFIGNHENGSKCGSFSGHFSGHFLSLFGTFRTH